MLDLKGYGWMLWDGVQITLAVAVCAMVLALGLGRLGAWGKLSQSKAAWQNLYQRREFLTRRGFPFWDRCDSRLAKEIRHVSLHCPSERLRRR